MEAMILRRIGAPSGGPPMPGTPQGVQGATSEHSGSYARRNNAAGTRRAERHLAPGVSEEQRRKRPGLGLPLSKYYPVRAPARDNLSPLSQTGIISV